MYCQQDDLKLRLIYISNYESESGKISAQPRTFVLYEAISYYFKQTVYMNTVESMQNECTGLCGNLYLAVMLIVLECCQTHDMSSYIERLTDWWVCWWINSRNNHPTHPPLPFLVCGQELRNARNRSHIPQYYSKSDLISSRVFDCPLRPSVCLGSKPHTSWQQNLKWPPKKTNSKHLNNYYNQIRC